MASGACVGGHVAGKALEALDTQTLPLHTGTTTQHAWTKHGRAGGCVPCGDERRRHVSPTDFATGAHRSQLLTTHSDYSHYVTARIKESRMVPTVRPRNLQTHCGKELEPRWLSTLRIEAVEKTTSKTACVQKH